MFFPSSVQDTKALIIIINSTIIYSIQMLADARIKQFWMPRCCAVTDVSRNMLLNPNLKELGGAPDICSFIATLKLRLKISSRVMGILRKLLLTPWTKLLISSGITLCHLALLNVLFMSDFLGLDLLVSWLPIKFLPLLHAVLMRLGFKPFL